MVASVSVPLIPKFRSSSMIELSHKQGSEDWHKARLGIPTASCFDRLVTPKKGEPSAQRINYMAELIAEKKLNRPDYDFINEFMERGKELEPQALEGYQKVKGVQVRTVNSL